jgi:integrase
MVSYTRTTPTRNPHVSRIDVIINSPNHNAVNKFIKTMASMNKATAEEYYSRLKLFDRFVANQYHTTIDIIIREIKNGDVDVYDFLANYIAHLQNNNINSTLTLKQRVVTAKNLLEYYDIDISPRKFKLKVKLPKVIRKEKEALSKDDVIQILNSCSDIRLKTYVMLLAGTGMRAVEALSTRLSDYNFNSRPGRVFLRGKYTKTKVDRSVFLTDEIVSQLKAWLEYKYRRRRISKMNDEKGNTITEYRIPEKNDNDLVFSMNNRKTENPDPIWIYHDLAINFGQTLDRIGKWGKEEGDHGRRRKITFHSLRRFVKSTISDLGYGDFSEFMIGHNSSTYYRRTTEEKASLFMKIEPYLTFLDYQQLERRGADISAQLQEKDKQIQTMVKKQEQFEQLIQSLIDSGQLKPPLS